MNYQDRKAARTVVATAEASSPERRQPDEKNATRQPAVPRRREFASSSSSSFSFYDDDKMSTFGSSIITVQDLSTARPLENEATESLIRALDARPETSSTSRPAVLSNISSQDVADTLLLSTSEIMTDAVDTKPSSFHRSTTSQKEHSLSSSSTLTKKLPSRSTLTSRARSIRFLTAIAAKRHHRSGTVSFEDLRAFDSEY